MFPSKRHHRPLAHQFFLLLFLLPFAPFPSYSREVTLLDCSCPRAFHPICGNDHQTYDSECFLECGAKYNRELKKAYEGVCCPSAELCADYFDPVCDQMGNFFENDCIFEFHKCVQRRTSGKLLRIEGRGEEMCLRKRGRGAGILMGPEGERQKGGGGGNCEELGCGEMVAPVCDSQGRTHKNRCKFELANCRLRSRGIISALHIVKEGPCRKGENNFGQFPNANSMRRMSMANLMEKRARKRPENGENNRRRNEPKKGEKEEENLKLLRDEQRIGGNGSEKRWELTQTQTEGPPMERMGPQKQREEEEEAISPKGECPRPSICPHILDPLCDSHNVTHQNECRFSVARCQFAVKAGGNDRPPRIAYRGKCTKKSGKTNRPAMECDFCKGEEKEPFEQIVPICDNTNLTHQSVCLFAQWNCDKRLRGVEEHILGHVGECNLLSPIFELKDEICPSKCSRHFKPVCDSNGITHPNLCTFQMHSCHQRRAGRPFGWLLSLRECAKSPPKGTREAAMGIECPGEPNCGESAEEDGGPICDNEGRLHKNTCLFAHAHCLAAKEGKTLRIEADGQKCTHFLDKPKEKRPENCERKWPNCVNAAPDPFCGSDFITYRNLCAIQRAQCFDNRVEILFKGECELCLAEPCALPSPGAEDSNFICDQSGETKTRCEFEMLRCIYEAKFGYNITAAYEGKCCPNEEICREKGERDSEGICDSKGEKHANRCSFEVAKCRAEKIGRQKLEEKHCEGDQGEKTPEIGAKMAEGVEAYGGGQMGKEMPTAPPVKNVSAELLSLKELICSDRYEPVCGTDGRTYRNKCNLERGNGTRGRVGGVKALYAGECCPGPEECGPGYSPICDNEGTTHLNFCEFGRQRCLAERSRSLNLTIISYAPCPGLHCPTEKCQSRYEPVCGTNGRTYANLCELDKSVCIVRSGKRGQRNGTMEGEEEEAKLALDYIGECCEMGALECGGEGRGRGAICDNLGRIYADECAFGRRACLAKKRDGQILRPIQCQTRGRKHRRRHRRRRK